MALQKKRIKTSEENDLKPRRRLKRARVRRLFILR
jgi:hypothetical protein